MTGHWCVIEPYERSRPRRRGSPVTLSKLRWLLLMLLLPLLSSEECVCPKPRRLPNPPMAFDDVRYAGDTGRCERE